MKKILLIGLSLLFIMSCEEDKDEGLSIIGTWNWVSITHYDNLDCTGSGETHNETGSLTYTETSVIFSWTDTLAFEDVCASLGSEEGADGSFYSASDTTCLIGYSNTDEMIASNQYNIAGGLDYSMAVNSDRTLTVWGSYSDENGNIDNVSNVFSIARGYYHTGVLFTDGTVGYYGGNGEGNPENIPDNLNEVIMLVGGADHFLALKLDGTVVAWGKDDTDQATVPSDLSGTIVGMSAGDNHSTVLFSDGTCRNWGNESGANDFTDIRPVPEAIASGRGFDIAIKNDGTVVSTDDPFGINAVPDGLSGVVAVACGNYHSLALKSDGTVVAWGNNDYGQTDVPLGLDNVVAIAGGMKGYHSIALKSDGTVVAWGNDESGQSSGVPDELDALVYISPTDVSAWTYDYEDFVYDCSENEYTFTGQPGTVDGLNCNSTFTDTVEYTYNMENMVYCEIYEYEDPFCGTAILSEDSLTMIFLDSWGGDEYCVEQLLSRE